MVEGLTISARDLERWAEHPDARHQLPRLVRRLLRASTRLRELDIPDDVDQAGYDGICRAEVGTAFCPSGRSFWELSVRSDVKSKLDADYTARTNELSSPSPDAFVLVTPRRFSKKREWVAARQNEKHWRDVKVLDGQDLAAWLEACPVVAAWFASEHLGRAVRDLIPLSEYVRRWSHATRPPLPESLVLAERRRELARIAEWLTGKPSTLVIQAATREEARVFAAAAIARTEDPSGDYWSSRALVVETAEAWRSLVRSAEGLLVLIPKFECDEPLDSGRHFACMPAEQVPHGVDALVLGPLPWREMQRALRSSGLNEKTAERLASESRGHISALRALLGLPTLPPWSAGYKDGPELVAMLLVGAWDPRVAGDCATIRALGAAPERLDSLCRHLCLTTGRPLKIENGVYLWSSPEAAWHGLHSLLTERGLLSFSQVATEVLREDDPRYQLPIGQRYAARNYGLVPQRSEALQRHVADSLLFLARFNDPVREHLGRSIPREVVYDVVRKVLTPTWIRWASLEDRLRVLAAAAPQEFLRCLRTSLVAEDGVLRLFDEEGHPGLAHTTPHVPLLWALEVLAWNAATLSDAADCLAIMAAHDPAREAPGGRVANRPMASLAAIFHRLTPQSSAGDETRFAVLTALVERRPEVGFNLLLLLLGQDGPSRHTRGPRVGEHANSEPIQLSQTQVEARSRRLLELLVSAAGSDATKWSTIIGRAVDKIDTILGPQAASMLIDALLSKREHISDPAAAIWNAARDGLRIFASNPDPGAEWTQRALVRLRRVVAAFEPTDPWPIFLRKFQTLDVPEGFTGNVSAQIEAQEVARVEALDATPSTEVEHRLSSLLAVLDDLRELGRALARCKHAVSWVARLLDGGPEGPLSRLVAPLAAGYYYIHGQDLEWLRELARRWCAVDRTDDTVATLLRIWAEPKIWDLVDELGEPVKTRYWRQLARVGQHDGDQWDRACGELLAAGNLIAALACAAWRPELIATEKLLVTLERLDQETLERLDQETNHQVHLLYSLERLFAELDRRIEAPAIEGQFARIAALELRFVAVLRHHRVLRYVPALFEHSPEFFAECVALLIPGSDDTAPAHGASHAYEALGAWETYPGSNATDPRVWEPILRTWAERALELVRESPLGVSQVAEVLARPEAGEDGHWPCEAARDLSELGRYPKLAQELCTAKYNLRGVVTWDPMVGPGAQDRALAEELRRSAAALRARWPATAQEVDALAELYERQAEEADEEARRERAEAGVSPAGPYDDAAKKEEDEGHSSADNAALVRVTHIEVEHVGPAPMLSLRCSERVNIIAGDNSLGKTFLLDVAWWALTGTWPILDAAGKDPRTASRRAALPAGEQSQAARIRIHDASDNFVAVASYRVNEEAWTRPASWPRARSPVIYARVDGGYSAWDPLLSDSVFPAYHFTEHTLHNGLFDLDGKPACEGLLAHWRDWRIGVPSRFAALLKATTAISPDGEVVPGIALKQFHKHDDREMPTLRFPYGDVPFEHLSTGWKRLLGLAYLLVWVWENHREAAAAQGIMPSTALVLLLDEAETHLHPRWQRRLLPSLLAAAEGLPGEPTVQLLVTTHSPMILASIEPDFDPESDSVFHLRLDETHKVVMDKLPWAKFGDASAWLESPLFGLGRATSPAAEAALAAARALMAGKSAELPPDLNTAAKIDAALRRSLAEIHPFWLRWSIFHDSPGAE